MLNFAEKCSIKAFKCNKTNKCIPGRFRCDKDFDCGTDDKSDEENCGKFCGLIYV